MPSTSEEAWALLQTTLAGYIKDCSSLECLRASFERLVPEEQRELIEAVLAYPRLSYRDGLLLQLAYKLCDSSIDATMRQPGARGTAQGLGSLFADSHIQGVNDAYENIGKNTANLVRGAYPTWDELLPWLNAGSVRQLDVAFRYACCMVASTARPVSPMPELNLGKLTFAAVMSLYERLLAMSSGGAHEQFIVASLLDALVNAYAPNEFYVETKPVSVADRSSQAAGDVQVKMGSRVIEAYEVTAAGWEGKLQGVGQKLRAHDLARMHIVAPLSEPYGSLVRKLLELQEDVSVIDLRGFASVIVSGLTHQYRAYALTRMYELLDRIQGDIDRVNTYVAALDAEGLVVVP